MVVTCENCESKFKLDDSLVKDSGSKVRCSSCQHVFTVFKPTHQEDGASVADLQTGEEDQTKDNTEESLDFDLFESEQDEDQGLSLEDFGLDDEEAGDGEPAVEKTAAGEDEITVEDLGFGDDFSTEAVTESPVEDTGSGAEAGDLGFEGLELEDGDSPEAALSGPDGAEDLEVEVDESLIFEDVTLDEDAGDSEVEASERPVDVMVEDEGEKEISFEDLSLEDESGGSDGMAPSGDVSGEEELEDGELSFDDMGFEEASEDTDSEGLRAEVDEQNEPLDTDGDLPEGVPVASLEDGDEIEENLFDEEVPPPEVIAQVAPKKRASLPLMICLVVVLVGGGAYAGFTFLKDSGIKVPFLESIAGMAGSDQADSGNLHITLMEDVISGEFVENSRSGKLFVIKGKIRSNYPETRNFIRMKGILYFRDGKVAQDKIVYCGNVLSDTELQTLDRESIQKRLSNRFGDNKANFKVASGKVLPFMVVFPDIPQELGEFSVEVVDSLSG